MLKTNGDNHANMSIIMVILTDLFNMFLSLNIIMLILNSVISVVIAAIAPGDL